MKRTSMAVALLALGAIAIAGLPAQVGGLVDVPNLKASMPERGRLQRLPDVATSWHTTLIVRDDWREREEDRVLVESFQSVPELVELKDKTHFHFYTARSPHYRERLARHYPTLPAVIVQKGDGTVVFKASGTALSPNTLTTVVAESAHASGVIYRCDGNQCVRVDRQKVEPQPDKSRGQEVEDRGKIAGLKREDVGLGLNALSVAALAFMAYRMKK